ncbi:carbohydrate-binding module family 5 protein [Postia placenta MAD-698-R-SB12]|uniref:chitinase n=1 Tax=Postia placenta MAD-698-R-SB12 TaxID=670580 RepID=A0A1X6MNL1_9APHY|nr:carbohydrate-binding module family 5 protein [Postia placenta MAD-698-R-SB12]OSX57816.1 carbohydrate-binding module family 5 protein [Postia placenta MAD-698-R-SB12]
MVSGRSSYAAALGFYWGQNSYGATGSNTADYQKNLSYYCQDDVINAFPLAFLNVFFGEGGEPSLDLANICSTANDPVFEGTQLPECSFMASNIQTCQNAGKIVTISLGGATGSAGFSNASQAEGFANTIWNLFLGGSSSTRPFGDAVLDGVDLDIEGGSTEYFTNFVSTLRSLMNSGSKSYYLTAAPQCPFPDAYVGSVIDAESFDAVYVQFYNNYCGLTNYDNSNDWDFSTWDNWAKNTSPNPNVKVYIGAPAASAAAGSGYVDAATLGQIAVDTRNSYSSFGGIMLWDASQAYDPHAANDRFDAAVKSSITENGNTAPAPSTTYSSATSTASATPTTAPAPSTTSTPAAPSSSSTGSAGDCAGVATWVANVAYEGGDQVVYNGNLYTANWWSYADTPGGASLGSIQG